MIESIFFHPWVWIVPIVLIVALAVTIVGIARVDEDDLSDWVFGVVFGGIAFLVLGVCYFGFMLPPYDLSFYQTYHLTGTITEIQAAFSGDEGTMSPVFIARVDGVEEFIRSDDQRFRTLEAGDQANFVCTKGFAYFQQPWYDCSMRG